MFVLGAAGLLSTAFRVNLRRDLLERYRKRTIQNHVDNMWVLGGEIIRDVNEEPRLRKSSAEHLVRKVIHEDGGPLIHNGGEDEQRSFDSTCRKFYRFLTQSQR